MTLTDVQISELLTPTFTFPTWGGGWSGPAGASAPHFGIPASSTATWGGGFKPPAPGGALFGFAPPVVPKSAPAPLPAPPKPPRPSYNPNEDPGVIAARNAAARRQASSTAARNAARKTAIIRFGINPNDTSVLAKLGFALSRNDLAAA